MKVFNFLWPQDAYMYILLWLQALYLRFLPTLYIRVRPWPQPFFASLTQDETKTQPVGTENPKNTSYAIAIYMLVPQVLQPQGGWNPKKIW